VEFPVTNQKEVSPDNSLAVDYDGDGVVDVEVAIWSDSNFEPEVKPTASTTPILTEKQSSKSSGTRILRSSVLPGPQVAGVADISPQVKIELMKQLITLLEKYRDVLIKLK
jgi:hypothetical protein